MLDVHALLISTEQYDDNEFLQAYIKLVSDNLSTECVSGKTDKHHIIPESLFECRGSKENNSENRVVNLLYKDHILAHYYLWKSAKPGTTQQYYNACAVQLMIRSRIPDERTSFIALMDDYQKLREDYIEGLRKQMTGRCVSDTTRVKLSEAHKGRKFSEQHCQALRKPKSTTINMRKPKSEAARIANSLAHKGVPRAPHTQETKQKISQSLMGHSVSEAARKASSIANKGKRSMYKDGEYRWVFSEHISQALADGWVFKGEPKPDSVRDSARKTNSSMRWVTDGVTSIRVKKEDVDAYLDKGFRLGRLTPWLNNDK